MLRQTKNLVKKIPFLARILLPVYIFIFGILYQVYRILHLHFSFRLTDGSKIKFLPKGQIAFGIFLNGFENRELSLFQALIKEGDVVVDAGANIGLYSIVGSRVVGQSGKVYCFEPSGKTFDILVKNIELNQCRNIHPVNFGLGEKRVEKMELFQEKGYGDAERYVSSPHSADLKAGGTPHSKAVLSEVISLDSLDHFYSQLNLSRVDFLKIDVEGYEYFLFKGAQKVLAANPGIVVLFECVSHLAIRAGASKEKVIEFLREQGFDLFYWNDQKAKWCNDPEGVMDGGQLLAGKNLWEKIQGVKG